MENVFDRIPFDNPTGGVWKQGFEITYSMDSYHQEPLQVFVVPHSHNDPGDLGEGRGVEHYLCYRKRSKGGKHYICMKVLHTLGSDQARPALTLH